jgi:hypothetical protein
LPKLDELVLVPGFLLRFLIGRYFDLIAASASTKRTLISANFARMSSIRSLLTSLCFAASP